MSFLFDEACPGNYCVKSFSISSCLIYHLATPGQIHGNCTNYSKRTFQNSHQTFIPFLKFITEIIEMCKYTHYQIPKGMP